VLSVWSRTPGTLALTAAHLQRLSRGRFVLGLGASTAPLTEGFHGLEWQAPLAKMRDVLTSVRALLAGERLPLPAGGARPLRLMLPPTPVPIGLAAISAGSVRLAGALADRWLPFLWPVNRFDEGRELLEQGALEAERTGRATVTACVPVAVGEDEEAAATVAARWLLTYSTSMGPVYPRVLRGLGYGAELDSLLAANVDPRHPVLPAAAERLAHDVLLFATEGDAGASLRRWTEASDDLSLVMPFGLEPERLDSAMHALAPNNLRPQAFAP
jgi:alkanesulfonate monooxygenase SsuD/methylene tetrahydromethanopterin reductase-like flavin-dependent oxidoreductase (luciferase family)